MNGPSGSCKLYYVLSALINELRRADIRKKKLKLKCNECVEVATLLWDNVSLAKS